MKLVDITGENWLDVLFLTKNETILYKIVLDETAPDLSKT